MEEKLSAIYYNPAHPGSYGGIKPLAKAAGVSEGKAKAWLTKQRVYTLHKQPKRRFPRRRIVVQETDEQWQVDLCDLPSIARYNSGNRYILTAIDCLSRFAWAVPLKNKNAQAVNKAMQKVFEMARNTPKRIQTDLGKEFYNSSFQQLMKQHGIEHFSTKNEDIKAAMVERFNRTLKERMWRYFSHHRTHRYIGVLPDLLNAYNNSPHSSLNGLTPQYARYYASDDDLWDMQYGDMPLHRKKKKGEPNLKTGDFVRIVHTKGPFKKGYYAQWTEEVFVIEKYVPRTGVYYIKDLQGELIDGTFYEDELIKVWQAED